MERRQPQRCWLSLVESARAAGNGSRARWTVRLCGASVVVVAAVVCRVRAQDGDRDAFRGRSGARGGGDEWRTPLDGARATGRGAASGGAIVGGRAPTESGRVRGPVDSASSLDDGADAALSRGRQVWRDYSLGGYSTRQIGVAHPEQPIVDWIIKQTGQETWTGEEWGAISASRSRVRVFHTPEVQAQVAEIIERFTRPAASRVGMRVQIITCSDLNWRNGIAHMLRQAASGEEGQQVWLIAPEDAALVRDRLRQDRQSRVLAQQQNVAPNGRVTSIDATQPVNYVSGLQLAGGSFVAYQAVVSRLNEGVRLWLTPLWTTDGSAVDVEIKLETRSVAKLHSAQTVAPLVTGNQNTYVQVPEVSGTSFSQFIRWPATQTLLVSAGIHPAGSSNKRGPLGLGVNSNEVLVMLELESSSPSSAGRRPVAVGQMPRDDGRE